MPELDVKSKYVRKASTNEISSFFACIDILAHGSAVFAVERRESYRSVRVCKS